MREALVENYLEELKDAYIALERLKKPGKIYSMEEVAKELNLTPEEKKAIGLED